jgi:GNAT superfamily N-acetyltransferase
MEPRPATLADTEELLRLAAVMFAAVGLDAADRRWEQPARERLRIGFGDGTVKAFVVDHPTASHRCVAAAAVSLQSRLPTPPNPGGVAAYVQWVATDLEFRRRGLARTLMESVLTWSIAQGAGSVDLHASAAGETLYRDLGFGPARNPELRFIPQG